VQDGAQESWAGFPWEKLVDFLERRAGLAFSLERESMARAGSAIAKEEAAEAKSRAIIIGFDLISPQTQNTTHLVRHGEPFDVVLKVHLPDLPVEAAQNGVPYLARVYAHPLGKSENTMVCKAEDRLVPDNGDEIRLRTIGLSPGMYRIIADLHLGAPDNAEENQVEGSLLQVF
jgi:hypothetical protein